MYSKRFRILPLSISLSLLTVIASHAIQPVSSFAQSLQETVNSANVYANNNNYTDAIPLY